MVLPNRFQVLTSLNHCMLSSSHLRQIKPVFGWKQSSSSFCPYGDREEVRPWVSDNLLTAMRKLTKWWRGQDGRWFPSPVETTPVKWRDCHCIFSTGSKQKILNARPVKIFFVCLCSCLLQNMDPGQVLYVYDKSCASFSVGSIV